MQGKSHQMAISDILSRNFIGQVGMEWYIESTERKKNANHDRYIW